jgi:nucleoside diphosphate kinase
MDCLRTDQDLPSGKATLLIFSPDATKGQLIGPIEGWIRERTDCAPIARRWFSHTGETVRRFYSDIPDLSPADWRWISRFFTAGPCLATLWFGENAAHAIANIKGTTHPARSPQSTVRGRFWCDNALANLIHVSDGPDAVARELAVLRRLHPDLFGGPLSTQALAQFHDPGPATPRHSGILTLCSLVTPLLAAQPRGVPLLDLPDGGGARETMARAEAWLDQVRSDMPVAVAAAVESYLNGTAEPFSFLRPLQDAAHIDSWDELILQCGLLSRPTWLEHR